MPAATSTISAAERLARALLRGDRVDTAQFLGDLCLPSAAFYQEDERAAIVDAIPPAAVSVLSAAIGPLVGDSDGLAATSLLMRTGKSLKGAALCAVELQGSRMPEALVIFHLAPALARLAEDALEALLRTAPETDVQVLRRYSMGWCTPLQVVQRLGAA